MRLVKLLLVIFILWIIQNPASSQVKASFIADTTKGCGQTIIQFTNTSSVSDSIRWFLGMNGITIKDSTSVSLSYPPGTYQVKLIAYNHLTSPSSDTSFKQITIYNPPTANFSANRVLACIPDTAHFTDMSQKGSGTIVSWYWDFRDGTTSTVENATHIYSSANIFSVYLKVTDSNQCISDLTKTNYITVANKPVVGFTASPSGGCTAPLVVTFNNSSTGPGLLDYTWNFGNSQVSFLQSPSTTYSALGNYQVQLTVTSTNYQCSSTLTVPSAVIIGNVQANGTLNQNGTIINNNGVICPGNLTYTSTSTGAMSVLWNFGDTTSSSNVSGVHQYIYPGNYTVTLIASSGSKCSDTLKWKITVEKVTAEFLESPDNSCSSSSVIDSFKNQSINAVSYLWTFTDGSTSTAENPTFTFSAPYNSNPYAINPQYTYVTKLSVTSPHGCLSSVSQNFIIQRPTAIFSIDTSQGCLPFKVKFTSQSISQSPIHFFQWQFGDGIDSLSLSNVYTHTYSSPGVYNARLIITNALNCIDTSYYLTVMAGNKPAPAFSVSPNPFCSSEPVQFTDLTPASDKVNYWQYSVGGRSLTDIPMMENPLVKVHADTGKLTATLLVGSNGCYATASSTVTNNGPVDSIKYSVNCNSPLVYNFTAIDLGATSFQWNFGDGTSRTDSLTLVHSFATPGDYKVTFIGINGGGSCTDTAFQIVKVRQGTASFTSPTKSCTGNTLTFIAAEASTDKECRDKYLWSFGDGSPALLTGEDTVVHTYLNRDTCKVLLTSIFDNGCTDTISKSLMIYQPIALFTPSVTAGCTPLGVTFTDQSVQDVNKIKIWNWNYGDGDTSSFTHASNNHKEYYSNVNTFKVVLTVIDAMNCSDTVSHLISTASPYADFYAPNGQVYCSNIPVQFVYTYPDPDSVFWTFGDGTTSRSKTDPISHTYSPVTSESTDTVNLIVYKNGCASPQFISPSNTITIQTANAEFQCDSVINCVSDQVTFTHLYPFPGLTGSWNFGDQTSSGTYITEPTHQYLTAGTYTVKLTIQTTAGCQDTYSRVITVKGPKGSFDLSKTNVCKSDTLTARLVDTSNVVSYEWVLGNGFTQTGNPLVFSYDNVGVMNFSLGLNGSGGCNIVSPSQTIEVDTLVAKFNLSDSVLCAQSSIQITNLSIGSNQQLWNFGDSTTSTQLEPPPHIYKSGNYIVNLYITNSIGCKDTARHSVTVNPLPNVVISTDKNLCSSDKLILIATTNATTVLWAPSLGLNTTTTDTVVASPKKTSIYKATVTFGTTNCTASDSIKVYIPYAVVSPTDTTVVLNSGNTIPIILKDSTGIGSFKWSPTTGLSCTTCLNPSVTPPAVKNNYTLVLLEPNGCFTDTINIFIGIDTTHQAFALPKAFRPGGEDINSYFKVRGRGIKQILEFNIYNRYGNLVFSTTDLSIGWDGTYEGQMQPMDTYIYTITVETYDGKISSAKGAVLLLR